MDERRARSLLPLPLRRLLYDLSPGRRRRWRRFRALERLPAGHNTIALTFDDGPDAETEPLLRTLDEHGIRATFFLVGEQAESRPELARRLVAAGHEIALHGSTHFRHNKAAADACADDVRRGLEQIESVADVQPRWYRPPFGKFSTGSFDACVALGLQPVYWSAWGHDWEPVTPTQIRERVERELTDGAIVLLHDSPRYAERDSALATVEAIAGIADVARARALDFVTLSSALPR